MNHVSYCVAHYCLSNPIRCIVSVAMVMNIRVEIVTSTSARVSWDAINFPGMSGYIVSYSLTGNRKRQAEQSVDVPGSSATSVVIEDLVNGSEYQFTVVALANLNGDEIIGPRAMPVVMRIVLAG